MLILIIGTPGCGKSEKAEELLLRLSEEGERIYIATMIPFGPEGEERIRKHRKMREGKGFLTVECPCDVDRIKDMIPCLQDKSLLLECMSNLAGNEMHADKNADLSYDELLAGIVRDVSLLGDACRDLVIVSNSFPKEDDSYDEDTRLYVRLVEDVNALLRERADQVYELIEGEWTAY